MAYYRKLKNGETKLIYTAQDKAKRESRRRVGYGNNQDFMGRQHRRLKHKHIEQNATYYTRYYRGRVDVAAAVEQYKADTKKYQRQVLATLRFTRTGVWSNDVRASGYLDEARHVLDNARAELRFFETVLRYIDNGYSFSYRRF